MQQQEAAMLTKGQALELVRQQIPSDCDVMEEATIERHYGWVFFYQTKRFIETRDPFEGLIGSGGVLVENNGGRCFKFGSRHSTDISLKVYEAGYLDHDDFDIVITAISNLDEALDLLLGLMIVFVKPEVAHGETWRIPTNYSPIQLRERLLKLPCRFNLGRLSHRYRTLDLLKKSSCLKYELVPNAGLRNEI